ncbi:MAG: hypothetical protein HQ565_10340 [Bacteroidetes bacterium]|nr:hypothetical protein [Bacteroidota bacterium]
MKKLTIILFLLISFGVTSQVVYESVQRTNIYDFLDEMANEKLIDINSVVKPYSRTFIAEKLQEAYDQKGQLNKRQIQEIEFYMKDYRLELVYNTKGMKPLNIFPKKDHYASSLDPMAVTYRDSMIAFSLRPIWGIEYFINSNESAFHRWGGVEGFGYIGKNLGAYSSLRDNHENVTLTSPTYFNQRLGTPVKGSVKGGIDYSEARGGLMYSWKWGAIGLVKDQLIWGNNYYGSNILSGRTPSFGQIKLQLKPVRWFEFNYIHGWLVSDVIDSTRSYWDGDTYREVMHSKFIAANMFTFIPFRHLNISIGNSIVYSDIGVQAAYLVPFLFYKSVDHTLNSTNNYAGQNSQLFFDISSRNIKHLHLFFSFFVDEFSISRVTNSDVHNFLSYKGGFRLSNWPVQNLSLITEYTYTLPMTYQHRTSSSTFESNSYNLGHYMRDNSQDLYLALIYKPIRGLRIDLSYNFAQHGNNYVYGVYRPDDGAPILKDITWQKSMIGLRAKYEFINNAYVFAGVYFSDINGYDVDDETAEYYLEKFTPEMYWGNTTTINLGFNIGF